MKLTIEHEDGKKEIFQRVTDLYIAYRQVTTVTTLKDDLANLVTISRSPSWGGNLRELAKELQQSLVELQDFLRGQRDGGTS